MSDLPPHEARSDSAGVMRSILGTSRFLVVLAVLGTFIAAATLMVFGLLETIQMVFDLLRGRDLSDQGAKHLIVDAVSIIDVFLLGTVLYIVSAGLYQLFVDHRLPMPHWLHIETLDDLKAKLTGVIVVGLLVAFFGWVVEWTGGVEIVALGAGIAAVILATGLYYRLTATGAVSPSYMTRGRAAAAKDEPPV